MTVRDDADDRSASATVTSDTHTSEPLRVPADGVRAAPVREPERYQILNEHGRGGLGRVFRAHDGDLGRDVAIKELISRGHLGEVRFQREALITARLEHPGIVPVYDAGRWPDGTPFYAMKLVAGRPLRELIAECATGEQRIGLLHHVIAVADAIAYAHGRKIIHRDLKPANVVVGEFGETVVIDWGLAKELTAADEPRATGCSSDPSPGDLTSAGSVFGTPAYMAPEQGRGEPVDQRADVFAIGMMLWELCSPQRVPPSEPVRRRRILRRAGIDHDLIAIIDKAIEADPERRYRDAGALAADLRAFKSGARIAARSYSLLAVLARWAHRHRVLTAAAIAIIAAAAIAYRAILHGELAQQLTELSITQAEVEQGRQALLHDDLMEAQLHLARAYQRGDRSPSVAFMLTRALQPRFAEQVHFTSLAGRMWSAEFSPDGRRVVTTDDHSAQVWDAQTGRALVTLPHGGEVTRAVYSADGARLVTVAVDGVRLWDATSGALVRALPREPAGGRLITYYLVALSADSKLIAACNVLGDVVDVWEADTGRRVAELAGEGAGFPSLGFSADGRWLLTSGGSDVRVFEVATWQRAMTIGPSHIRQAAFDPSGTRIATGSVDGDVAIWAVPSGTRIHQLHEAGDPIDALAFAPNGELVATGARDGAVDVWNAASGALYSRTNQLRDKIGDIAFDPTSTLVAASATNGKVGVEQAGGQSIARFDGFRSVVRSVGFDPSGRRVIASSWDGHARVWDVTAHDRQWSSPPVGDFCGHVTYPDPDRRFVAVSCWHHASQIWDTARDQLLAELPGATLIDGDNDGNSAFAAVTADGSLAAVARDNTVVVYALPGGRAVRTVVHRAAVSALAFAATGRDLISGSVDGAVLVTREGRDPLALPPLPGRVDAVGLLADRRVLAAAGSRLRVYDLDRAAMLAELTAPERVNVLRPSPDGRRLVTLPRNVNWTEPAAIWDLEHYRLIRQLDAHIGYVWSAQFVRDGRELLTAGGDGSARTWDAATGSLLHTYRGSSRFLADATLDPTGTMVVAAGGDGLIRFWDAASERPLWTFPAHQPHAVGLHFEGDDLVTRGFSGDLARWRLPAPGDLSNAVQAVLREAAP